MEVLKQQYSDSSFQSASVCKTQVYQCNKYAGLVSPVYSTCNSEAEEEQTECHSKLQQRAVQFQQCPRPSRAEPVCKKLRCPTPPVSKVLIDDEDDYEEEDDEDESEQLDTIHADRLRRCSLSSEDASDSDDSDVFYCE